MPQAFEVGDRVYDHCEQFSEKFIPASKPYDIALFHFSSGISFKRRATKIRTISGLGTMSLITGIASAIPTFTNPVEERT